MAITATEARAKLFPLIEQVNTDLKPIVITSKNGNAVLIAESEYEAILETEYLLSSPANRKHLLESIAQADRGETFPYIPLSEKIDIREILKTPTKKVPARPKKKLVKRVAARSKKVALKKQVKIRAK